MKEKKLDPLEYFEKLKSKKNKWNTEKLKLLKENTEKLLQKAYSLGQISVCEKLIFNVEVIQKENQLFELGIDTFIYKDDIIDYIENVSDEVVKIIEIKHYPREIPSAISDKILELKEKKIFDDYVIVFTDYTGETEKKIREERRRKDPIIFGVFKKDRNVSDRFYFLGDWEDEYCNLTLDKMIGEMSQEGKKISHEIKQSVEVEEIRLAINSLKENTSNSISMATSSFKIESEKKSFFKKVKTWLAKK